MSKKIKLLALVFFALSAESFSQSSYKVINLCNNKISLSVPAGWKIKENAMRFAVYEIKYNVEVKDSKNHSGLALYVYGAQYGPKMQITDSVVKAYKQGVLSDPVRKIKIEDSGIKVVSRISVGYFKYTFRVSVNKKINRSFGIDMFFCDERNIYYRIEITGLNKSVEEFKTVAEKIFESLSIQ